MGPLSALLGGTGGGSVRAQAVGEVRFGDIWRVVWRELRVGLLLGCMLALLGLVVGSLFVGWGFPLGMVAIALAIVALRRPFESRGLAVWAIMLGAVSIVYSIGWLAYAASFF